MTTTLFERYLARKKKNSQKICVYLKATQTVPDKFNKDKETKVNNLMLSGKVADVDSECLELENQECLIPLSSILSIKPA